MLPLSDRAEAGRLLAAKLPENLAKSDVVVIALPRGGVSVAAEIAKHLRAPLDVVVVRKVGVPWEPELAMGAVASDGVTKLDHGLIRSLGLSNYFVYALVAKEEIQVREREHLFRNGHPAVPISGRTILLVDDGAATGSTMLAATAALRKKNPKEIIVAVPVASRGAQASIEDEIGKFVCLSAPEPFVAVGQWYRSFPQISDEEVQRLLSRSRLRKPDREFAVASAAAQ